MAENRREVIDHRSNARQLVHIPGEAPRFSFDSQLILRLWESAVRKPMAEIGSASHDVVTRTFLSWRKQFFRRASGRSEQTALLTILLFLSPLRLPAIERAVYSLFYSFSCQLLQRWGVFSLGGKGSS